MGIGASKLPRSRPGIVITLDALGTIYKFREPITTQYIKVAGNCGLPESSIRTDELSSAFRKAFKDISNEYPNYGKGKLNRPRAWWKTLTNDTFRRVVDDDSKIPEHLGDELYNHFTSSAAYELYPDTKAFFASMRELKTQYSRPEDPPVFVGVISNSDPRVKSVLQSLGLRTGIDTSPTLENHRERTERVGLDINEIMKSTWHDAYNPLNDIDFLATSYGADSEKPAPDIFEHGKFLASVNFASKLEQSRADWRPSVETMRLKMEVPRHIDVFRKSKYVHVGDDYEKDYYGAENAGFEAMHLVREEDGTVTGKGSTMVTNLHQAAAAIRMLATQELGRRDE